MAASVSGLANRNLRGRNLIVYRRSHAYSLLSRCQYRGSRGAFTRTRGLEWVLMTRMS